MADGLPARGSAPNMAGPKDLGHENKVLRELVTVYRHLSGLALQNADLDTLAQLLADRTDATVAVVNEMMDVLAAGAPGVAPEQAADTVREQVVHPRLGQVLRASRQSHRALRLPRVGDMPAGILPPHLVREEGGAPLPTLRPPGKKLPD